MTECSLLRSSPARHLAGGSGGPATEDAPALQGRRALYEFPTWSPIQQERDDGMAPVDRTAEYVSVRGQGASEDIESRRAELNGPEGFALTKTVRIIS
jgi:hypothetical protein